MVTFDSILRRLSPRPHQDDSRTYEKQCYPTENYEVLTTRIGWTRIKKQVETSPKDLADEHHCVVTHPVFAGFMKVPWDEDIAVRVHR